MDERPCGITAVGPSRSSADLNVPELSFRGEIFAAGGGFPGRDNHVRVSECNRLIASTVVGDMAACDCKRPGVS
jgi:hypothetical protein